MLTLAALPESVVAHPAGTAENSLIVNGPNGLIEAVEAIEDLTPPVAMQTVLRTELDTCAYCPRDSHIDPHDGVVIIARQKDGSPWVTREPACPGCIGYAVGEAHYEHTRVWIELPTAVTS
jgi:hypothetical protein